ncbi:hypothetical protein FHY55_10915 [Oceanicola sp. D3]|uniref:hypothetical protein n=1 Tax=Oceanicola sp. D3 TaxID=2587163 RepID=UPI00111CD0DC|nr:hypothetical protein [Oceanicola sp. D3]QDC09725.1 hypothetical protein FHY55_10915 [Oceanicola sp. D3]
MRAIVAWVMMAGAACAAGPERGPELQFFEGNYELVGRGPGGALMEKKLALRRGLLGLTGLTAEGCDGPAGRLGWARVHESWRLDGRLFGVEVSCTYAVDAGNYPQLICAAPGGVRLVGWPEAEFGGELDCE